MASDVVELQDNHRYKVGVGLPQNGKQENGFVQDLGGVCESICQLKMIQGVPEGGRAYKKDYGNLNKWVDLANSIWSGQSKKGNGGLVGGVILRDSDGYEHNAESPFLAIENGGITTGNLVGIARNKSLAIKVSSRFGDCFLRYIISDADGFLNVAKMGGASVATDGYEWLLGYLWNVKLRLAYRCGLPKCYLTRNEQLASVRGNVDVVDYYDYPHRGHCLCRFRELSYDNPAVELFGLAWKILAANPQTKPFCKMTHEAHDDFMQIPTGKKRTKTELLKTKHFTNAVYGDYNTLIDLSKRVIRRWSGDLDVGRESDLLLFDVSMLFEYFVRKTLLRAGLNVWRKSRESFRLIDRGLWDVKRELQPDLVIQGNGGVYVFDVKYKYFSTSKVPGQLGGVDRNDIFQLHTYVGCYGNDNEVKGCGFIYPVKYDRWEKDFNFSSDKGCDSFQGTIRQHGKEIPFYVVFIQIPKDGSGNFIPDMNSAKKSFIEKMRGICM